MSRPDQLRQLATQLESLTSLEDTVAQGIHSLLVTALERTAPAPVQYFPRARSRSRSRSPSAPARRGSILLSEAALPRGLAVKCCLLAPSRRTRLSRVRSVPPASVPQDPAESANAVRAPSLLTPRGAPDSLHPPVAQLARQDPLTPLRLDGAAVTNAADVCAGQALHVARGLVWRAPLFAMRGCCDASSSDDDEHNTSNSLLLARANALIADALLSSLTEPDDLSVALSCRFARDMWRIMQHEDPSADQDFQCGQRFAGPTEPGRSLRAPHASGSRLQRGWRCLSGHTLSFCLFFTFVVCVFSALSTL